MNKFSVLIACEYTGEVRNAFKSVGWDAVSCDLKESITPGAHYTGDVTFLLSLDFDLLIAFPPCTYLSDVAAQWRPDHDRFLKMIEALKFFHTLYTAPFPHVAIENPKGIISTAFRKPDQYISPHLFGGTQYKRTGLWLRNLPKLVHSKEATLFDISSIGLLDQEFSTRCNAGQTAWYNNNKKDRDKTFPAIAQAMAEQWSIYIESKSNKIK